MSIKSLFKASLLFATLSTSIGATNNFDENPNPEIIIIYDESSSSDNNRERHIPISISINEANSLISIDYFGEGSGVAYVTNSHGILLSQIELLSSDENYISIPENSGESYYLFIRTPKFFAYVIL